MHFVDDGLDGERRALLAAALPHVPWDGWSARTLKTAAKEVGIDDGLAAIAFPEGGRDLLHFWSQELDIKMIEALEARDLAPLKVRQRVTLAVHVRIELMSRHREAVRRASAFLILPHNAGLAAKLLYGTVNAIWHGIGDRSTDWNFYSKRALLAAVFSSTVLFWLGDDSENAESTWAFLDRRIEDVMSIEKGKARWRAWTENLPSPFSLLDDLFDARRAD